MAHKLGTPKALNSGRKKGTPNKSTLTLLQKCEAKGIDVFEAMLDIAIEGDLAVRFAALKEVAQYIYPKRKSLEHSGSIDPKMAEAAELISQMTKEEQIQALEEELKKLKE